MRTRIGLVLVALLALATGSATAIADSSSDNDPSDSPATSAAASSTSKDAREAEAKAAADAAEAASTKGPANIPLLSQAILNLPAGYGFVPVKESNRLMRSWGNSAGGDGFMGLIYPTASNENWFITANFVDAGYVKDEEAKKWDTDALLENAKKNVEADNEDRVARGFEKIKVDGWIEKPTYDATQHRLIYSMALSALDAPAGGESSVNFHTYALGREGYIALDLVTGSATIEQFKDRARTVLAALDYKPGKKYEEYVASTDRVAEYGIAALIGGLAAKKLGLLALAALALTKFGGAAIAFAKPIGVALVALFASIGRFFTRRKKQ